MNNDPRPTSDYRSNQSNPSFQHRGAPRERPQGDRNAVNRGPGRVTLNGKLIKTGHGEAIVVKFKLWLFQVNLLVNIPFEEDTVAPVYAEILQMKTSDLISDVMVAPNPGPDSGDGPWDDGESR